MSFDPNTRRDTKTWILSFIDAKVSGKEGERGEERREEDIAEYRFVRMMIHWHKFIYYFLSINFVESLIKDKRTKRFLAENMKHNFEICQTAKSFR